MNLEALIAEQRRYEEFCEQKRKQEKAYGNALKRIEQIQKAHPNSEYVRRRREELKQYMRKNSPYIRVGKKKEKDKEKDKGKYKRKLDGLIREVTQLRMILPFAREVQQALFIAKRNLLSQIEEDDTD